ncbi:hypothetical protein B0H14DRAFT_2792394 [Mycena olivaceomarginata]|nr:hypothetical protein B0H14DRAFT_2792394 [Mycena olivaceomarginata]
MRSPFIAIAAVERGLNGAWQKFERGELPLFTFYEEFSRDLSDTTNGNTWYAAYCKRKGIACPELPKKLDVDGREHKIIALTNNFARTSTENPIPASELACTPSRLRGLFDDFCDSSELGSRKPERRFYQIALDRNGLRAEQSGFPGRHRDNSNGIRNLKAAKELGMGDNSNQKLEAKLGIDLTSHPTEEEVVAKL